MAWGHTLPMASEAPKPEEPAPKPADPAPKPEETSPVPDAAASQIAKLEAKLAAYDKRENERAAADAAAHNASKGKLKSDGKLQELLDAQNTELEALKKKADELQAHAKIGQGYIERETARIDAAKSKLTPSQQKLLDRADGVEMKALMLDEFIGASATSSSAPTPRPGAAGGPPPAGGAVDFAEAWKHGGEEWQAAKKRDPAGAGEWMRAATQNNGGRRPLEFLPAPVLQTAKQ